MDTAAAQSYVPISGAGSTWSENALQQWIRNVKSNYGMQVNYSGTGSSDGRNQFKSRQVDFAVSEIEYGLTDAGVTDTPPGQVGVDFAYMPIVAGGTSFMYNLTIGGQRVRNLRLSGATIAKIFTGQIISWDHPEIKADNPALALPARKIVPVVRADGSGTTAQFTRWLDSQHKGIWSAYCQRTGRNTSVLPVIPVQPVPLASIEARSISAWFGERKVLDRVSLTMQPGRVTALIGPSGCGKSTFLRILNRMHELVPSASLAGEVWLDGVDIYERNQRLTDARRHIGMVFQKPNPFPAMSIYDNVLAGLKLTGIRANRDAKDALVEECLIKAGLWVEVRDRLRQPGGALSGGQQQRLCIARSLAVRPRVLLMDEPCSALDPTSTRRIEETIGELVSEVTIVIVTHNMQQAARVSQHCAFFLATHDTPGHIVEAGGTEQLFTQPKDPRTSDYVHGRFG